ncbi:hypothetical protein CBS101457_006883 [Exobasidium rhododendri]|nr:hypothetical protein CBS101457_006883 [Exobasidium rhododendri]
MAPISRISLACLACRTKKTRCGGQKPVCDNCLKSESECSYNTRSDQRKPYSKAFVSTLQARINSLEKELGRHATLEPERTSKAITSTPEPSTSSRPLYEGDLVGQLAKRGGNLLRHADTVESQQEGTFRFFGASSNRNFQVAHRPKVFDFARLAHQSRQRLSGFGLAADLETGEAAEALYHSYFERANPMLMLLEEDIFRKSIALGDSATHLSLFLLNAICAMGAFTGGDKSSCEVYLERARLLMDVESATPQITTVQALILTGHCEAACGRESRGWLFIGMASRVALELGLARDSHEYVEIGWMKTEDMQLRHRTLWSLFIVDKFLSLYYGRPFSLDASVISVTSPSTKNPAQGALSIACPRLGTCPSCDHREDLAVSLFELTNYSVEIYQRLYANPILKGDASSRWTDWASDLNLRLAQWSADLPRPLKCTFTRGQVPNPSTIFLHLIYHSLVILLNRPFLPLGVHMSEAAFSAKSCHLASRSITRLMVEMELHYSMECAHNFTVYIVHTAITIALLNSKSSTGTVQREARNDLKSLVKSLRVLSRVHLNAVNVYRLITALVRRSFNEEQDWVDTMCEADDLQDGASHPSTSLHPPPPSSRSKHYGHASSVFSNASAFPSYSLAKNNSPMDIGAILQSEQIFSDADLSQFALVDWDSYAAFNFGDNVIGGIDIQPWLK